MIEMITYDEIDASMIRNEIEGTLNQHPDLSLYDPDENTIENIIDDAYARIADLEPYSYLDDGEPEYNYDDVLSCVHLAVEAFCG